MFGSLKALVVVLLIGYAVFWIGKPMALKFMSAEDFNRRRSAWFVLTAVAFVVPKIWIFFVFAFGYLFVMGAKDRNPMALMLLLAHVVPTTFVSPSIGVRLVDMNSLRLLVLAILIPALIRQSSSDTKLSFKLPQGGGVRLVIGFLIAYNAYLLLLNIPYESPTHTIRRLIDYSFDSMIVFLAFHRLVQNMRVAKEAFACLCIGTSIIAVVGVFEWLRHWLLYVALTDYWGISDPFAFLMRGGSLRAQASTGHSMTLGYTIGMAFILWLGIARHLPDKRQHLLVIGVFVLGCFATLARSGMVVMAAGYLLYMLFGKESYKSLAKHCAIFAVLFGILLMSPGGARIVEFLPFVGGYASTVDYRESLMEVSWMLIWRNPLFGDPFVMRHMESLRQGQGIIDLVNVYASVTLFSGFVGLVLFLFPSIFTSFLLARVLIFQRKTRSDLEITIAAVLFACFISNFVMFSVGSLGLLQTFLYWGFVAISLRIAYPSLEEQSKSRVSAAKSQTSVGKSFAGATRPYAAG
jgi:hypothetical protein